MAQFPRVYELTIFSQDDTQLFRTDSLQIIFDVKTNTSSVPNEAEISIFGLSRETRNNIRQYLFKTELRAGYPDNNDIIFSGQLRNVQIFKSGADIETVLTAGDGFKGLNFGTISESVAGGTSLKQVLERIAQEIPDVSPGILSGLDGKTVSERGIRLAGPIKIVLDNLATAYKFSWSIQGGLLETVALTAAESFIGDAGENAYVISSDTGMIDIPQAADSGKVSVKTLLNPRIKPNRIVNIQSDSPVGNGFYLVEEANFKGKYRGNDWYVDIKGIPLQ